LTKKFLPYGRQTIDDDDIKAVVDVLKSDFLTTGPAVDQFEKDLAAKIGVAEAVVCSNGTTALHLAVLCLDLQPGDKVIIPAVTFVATANVVKMTGADVVFADVNPNTGLMEGAHFTEAMVRAGTDDVKAVIPVHLTGQCADLDEINRIAAANDIKVITDCCHALGGTYEFGIKKGNLGDCKMEMMGCFSFHPVKSIAMGEGGAVTTNAPFLANKLRAYRNHGMIKNPDNFENKSMGFDGDGTPNPWYHEFHEVGYNYRATDMQCALGSSQLKKLDSFIAKRHELANLYRKELTDLAPHVVPISLTEECQSGLHLFVALFDFDALGISRAKTMKALADKGIGSQVHYIPLHLHKLYIDLYGEKSLPGAEGYYAKALSLPLYPAMELEDVTRVVDAIRSVI
jgi:UDP-4-amino-4,6-dideoxy-N-acetyl-beta-L-altrosamine transaminase